MKHVRHVRHFRHVPGRDVGGVCGEGCGVGRGVSVWGEGWW